MKKVMVFGTFDIIHPGHMRMLKEAKQYGDHLTVVVARDETVIRIKRKPPLNDEQKRLENLLKLKIAESVILGNFDDHYLVVKEVDPDVVALGYDQKVFVDNLVKTIDDHVHIVRLTPHMPEIYKSSKLRKKYEKK